VTASQADTVICRLEAAGILRPAEAWSSARGGPRVRRWQVNPALAGAENGQR
jgi:hypothetical protein